MLRTVHVVISHVPSRDIDSMKHKELFVLKNVLVGMDQYNPQRIENSIFIRVIPVILWNQYG